MPDSESTRRAKSEMRRELSSRRRDLSSQSVVQAAARVCELICRSGEFAAADTLLLYAALPDEVPTQPIFEAARSLGKRTGLPRITSDDRMQFVAVDDWQGLRGGRFGVLEPDPEAQEIPLADGQLMIVPGVGFTSAGHRLGRGGGYYDRALAGAAGTPCLIGLCFSCQLVADLPSEAHDQRVQVVVSERGLLRVSPDPGAPGRESRESRDSPSG